ncbi:RHS repeat-associated core domain-containing protein [Nitrospirillum sp. BR 11163]|uniref:RHS repeat-associated core domain-containing protein n=1 Tax=Nitrospirillum sp. BR 11163 TaxID=3104323 RepID=UPI003A4C6EE2
MFCKVGYLAFGENPAAYAGATFRYTGQRLDPETGGSASQPSGLYHYRARAYSPTLGRFLQPDPAGYSAGANLYAYVNNDPLNLIDPYGLTPDGSSGSWIGNAGNVIANNPLKVGGAVLAGGAAIACVIVEPCGAVVATAGGGAALTGETAVAGGAMVTGTLMMAAPTNGGNSQNQNQGGGTGGGGSDEPPGNYLAGKAPLQVTPGTDNLNGQYINDVGRVEPWNAHYDQYGRLIGRTDYNAGNPRANIPDVHYHTYVWGPGMQPFESGSHIPGEFPGGN